LKALEDILKKKTSSENFGIQQLVDDIFKPKTADWKCSMRKKLEGKRDSNGNQAVGKMEYFVSYSWSYKIGNLMQALAEFEASLERERKDPVYFFIDCVCINQWDPEKHISALDTKVEKAQAVVTVIVDWENPIPLKRAWCLLEMSVALWSYVPLKIVLTSKNLKSFRAALFSDFDSVVGKIEQIDVRTAEATKIKDLTEIKQRIAQTCGYSKLNNTVIRALKNWLVNEVEQMLEAISNSELLQTNERSIWDQLEIFAMFKRHMGDFHAAEKMYHKIYYGRFESLGATNISTIVAQCNYGNCLREQQKLKVAGDLLFNCYQTAISTLGENHAVTLITQSCWGLLQKDLGNLNEAEKILRDVKQKGISCEGKWSRAADSMTRTSNVALVLQLQGKAREAVDLLKLCHSGTRRISGERHDFVFVDKHNLGAALCRSGEHSEAEEILRKCYDGRVELLGYENLRTLMTRWWYAICLIKLGDLEKGREHLEEVMLHLESFYGSSQHEQVCKCRRLYERINPPEWREEMRIREEVISKMMNESRDRMTSISMN